jgi:NADH-quinone oxidoreductase subunit C
MTQMDADKHTVDVLKDLFVGVTTSEFHGQTRAVVPIERLDEALTFLKSEGFDLLVDITCVDYLRYRGATDRFGLAYVVTNRETNEQLVVRTFLNEPDLVVPSVTPLWEGANWMEREVWDMFGIRFDGHPDLRRILLPEEFTAFPLRKDYPLQGRGERHNFPVLTREDA